MQGAENSIDILSWLERTRNRLFPERQIVLRTEGRVSFMSLSRNLQMTMAGFILLLGGWGTFTSVNYVLNENVMASKDSQVANARLAYRSLLSEMQVYQEKYTAITAKLEDNHSMMLGLVEQNASLQQNLKTVTAQLKNTEQERETVLTVRENLKVELSSVENDLRALTGANSSLKGNLDSVEKELQTALSERNESLFEGTRMRRQIKELDSRLVELEESEKDAVQQLAARTVQFNDNMLGVIEMTGLNPDKLLITNGSISKAQGGPFIAAKPDSISASKLKASLSDLDQHLLRSEGLQEIMGRMPLAPPLTSYRVTSPYGKRRDPINNKWSAHYGLDMGSPFKSPVYVAAPGIVTFAGWKGKYGKMIEIDHGAGLVTRFGHLNKILVKKGQQVNFRDKVGLLGSTGRSTGAHLHYEISFRGSNINPLKFFKAGRYVFQE
ncbi:MAG: peptidoglycan DD-metalloendopeptidase family protein [Rhodospirillaceae bacterium]|nr:peptidoglycan DD-metalloendopeptidase family protein [Rhodospirillaceae bacterium]